MRHHSGGGIPLNRNHVFDSNGPDLRIRGTAQQLFEKYLQLGRDYPLLIGYYLWQASLLLFALGAWAMWREFGARASGGVTPAESASLKAAFLSAADRGRGYNPCSARDNGGGAEAAATNLGNSGPDNAAGIRLKPAAPSESPRQSGHAADSAESSAIRPQRRGEDRPSHGGTC